MPKQLFTLELHQIHYFLLNRMPRLKRKSEQMIKKCDSNRKKVKICNDGVDGPQLLMDSNEVKMKCPQTDRYVYIINVDTYGV